MRIYVCVCVCGNQVKCILFATNQRMSVKIKSHLTIFRAHCYTNSIQSTQYSMYLNDESTRAMWMIPNESIDVLYEVFSYNFGMMNANTIPIHTHTHTYTHTHNKNRITLIFVDSFSVTCLKTLFMATI